VYDKLLKPRQSFSITLYSVLGEGEALTVLQAVSTNLPKNSEAENEKLLEEILMATSHVIQNVIKAPSSGFMSCIIHKKSWSFSNNHLLVCIMEK